MDRIDTKRRRLLVAIFDTADTASFRAKLGRGFYGRWGDQLGSTAWSLLESKVGTPG
jgi:hypothetical protein